MEESGKSIQEQVDFWLKDKRVLNIMHSNNNVFIGWANPKTNPKGFVELCCRLDSTHCL